MKWSDKFRFKITIKKVPIKHGRFHAAFLSCAERNSEESEYRAIRSFDGVNVGVITVDEA